MLDQALASLAMGCAAAVGAPFIDAAAVWRGQATKDAGGSIVSPGMPITVSCKAQFDTATEAMRAAEGFLETDVRILVLAASLAGQLDASATIIVEAGEYTGTWSVLSCQRDPAGIGYECRARRT